MPKRVPDVTLGELQNRLNAVVGRVDIRVVARREERLVGAGLLFVPANARNDAVDVVFLERVVQRDGPEQVVADVRIKQERERILLVLQNLADVVLIVVAEFVHGDVVTGLQVVLLDVLADIFVLCVHHVDTPLVGPVVDEVLNLVEVLEVIDEHGNRVSKPNSSATSLMKYSVSAEPFRLVNITAGFSYSERPARVTSIVFSIFVSSEP